MTNKSLVIGIGGTGLSAIRELRRLIAERFENGLADQGAASIRFLYIDTDDGDVNTHTWSVMGKDIALKTGEIITVTGDKLRPLVDNSSEYPDIASWLPQIQDFVGQPGPGAKGIRPYGRLIYEYSGNKEKIRAKCVSIFHDLNNKVTNSNAWRFYLIASLSGGTGSGMALPFALDFANRWRIFEEGTGRQKFYSFFVLPPVQMHGRHDRYHANAYAALKELNYQTFHSGLPFSNCYLLEPQNEKGMVIGLDNLPLLIAQRIFVNLQGGAAQSRIAGMMDNPNLQETSTDELSGRRHARSFSSFGISSVSYPREMVAKCLGHQMAIDLASSWLAAREHPKNVNQLVRQELDSIGLSLQHVFGDSNPFGTNDYQNHTVEIDNLVDERLQGIARKQLGGQAGKIRQTIEISFRGVGIREFYQQRENDVRGAVEESLRKVHLHITSQLRNPRLGLAFAKEFLDELQKILSEHRDAVVALAGEKTNKQIQILQQNLSDTINIVHTNEQKLLYTDGVYQKDRANVEDCLKNYLKRLAGHHAGKYGSEFVSRMIPQIEALRASIDRWERDIHDVLESLRAKLHKILEELEKGSQENGKVIFDRGTLENLAHEVVGPVALSEIETNLCEILGQTDFDLVTLTSAPDIPGVLFEAAYQWVLKDGRSVDVTRVTLFDKLIAEVPKDSHRQAIFRTARDQSAIFLKIAHSEWGRLESIPTDVNCVAVPNLVGLKSADGRPSQSVVKADLANVGVPDSEVIDSDDLERIVFVQERQGFPLRVIETLQFLSEQYEAYAAKEALHIDKATIGKLYELYLPTAEERDAIVRNKRDKLAKAREDTFLVARAFGWLMLKTNQHTNMPEIRYEYTDENGFLQKCVFGNDWEEARSNFLNLDSSNTKYREARGKLEQQSRTQKMPRSPNHQQDLHDVLADFLNTSVTDYKAGIDDPRYERDRAVVERILAELTLAKGAGK